MSRTDDRRSVLAVALRRLAAWYPWSAPASEELDRALSFLGWSLRSETVVAAGYTAGGLTALAVLPLGLLVPGPYQVAVPPAALAGVLGCVHAVHRGPIVLASVRRTTALGAAPGILVRAVLRMRIEPTAEAAAAFAAQSGRGPLAASLAQHVRRASATPRSGLSAFAEEWAEWFPALRRSTGLVVAAADAAGDDRTRTLDRALAAILDGTRDRMAAFADDVRAPATALYAFGVLLPLALVAILPAARAAGLPVSLELLVVCYDVLLPVTVVVTSGWLLVHRPVAFPPPDVGTDHPDVPDRRWPFLVAGGVAAACGAVVVPQVLPAWSAPIAAVGGGVGVALVGLYRPVARVRQRVRSVEDGLPDALYLVGRRVAEGEAVESAIEHAAGELSGETGAVLEEAAGVGRRLRVGVRASFLGEYGALAAVPSPRARSTAALLASAAEEGRPAGSAVVAMASHLDELQSVEREARRELAQVTDTLEHTAAVFAPLVAGATVALSAAMDAGGLSKASGVAAAQIPTGALGVAVGGYVMFLAAALAALATGLRRGLDPALVGYRVGQSLLAAVCVYLTAVHVVSGLL